MAEALVLPTIAVVVVSGFRYGGIVSTTWRFGALLILKHHGCEITICIHVGGSATANDVAFAVTIRCHSDGGGQRIIGRLRSL